MGSLEIVFNLFASPGTPALVIYNNIPLVPYPTLILQQLQVWDTLPAEGGPKSARGATILHMLNALRGHPEWEHDATFDTRLHVSSVDRVARFFAAHPNFRKEWQRMGLMPHRIRERPAKVHDVAHELVGRTLGLAIVESRTQTQSNASPSTSAIPTKTTSTSTIPAAPASTSSTIPVVPTIKPPKLSRMQIRRLAAHTVVDILRSCGFASAIFGSMACKLYGNPRIPNDVDVLVLPPSLSSSCSLAPDQVDQESLKELLLSASPDSFVLKPARDPKAAYRVLWFLPTPTAKPTPHSGCKVDILLPGVMGLPNLTTVRGAGVTWRGMGGTARAKQTDHLNLGPLPVLPFHVLLLQKLQAWDDHRRSPEERYAKKAPVDVQDLRWLLDVGVPRYLKAVPVSRDGTKKTEWNAVWSDRAVFDEEFEARSRERVGAFCEVAPESVGAWSRLGFDLRVGVFREPIT
ncbi:hypothetical protein DXG03_008223 [Asterophora parasitica]|uniref:Uncharacterized protein n=1 Tax=Asterophora parasitica TaxID=117018 RepID=A0A9P7G483_9AGAR|nr:hypothetical protein DXG03_008223 [Asterophora parasitica]